jgi:hypothetical protein
MSSRERDQADLDLDTFIELFDEAISSDDPRVQRALQDLLVISALIRTKSDHDQVTKGPLRRLFDDVHNINRRLINIEFDTRYDTHNTDSTSLKISAAIADCIIGGESKPNPFDLRYGTHNVITKTKINSSSNSGEDC